MKSRHLTDELIVAYVTGAALEGVALAAAAHLTYCADCRRKVDAHEAIAGAILSETAPVDGPGFDQFLDRLDEVEEVETMPKAGPLPAPVAAAVGIDFEDIPWRFRLPGVYVYEMLNKDGEDVSLMKVRPGAAIPSHTHEAEELTVVFEGQLEDDGTTYKVGDISVADADVDHTPRAGGTTPCICLAVLSGGVKFTGSFGRALNLFS